MKPKLCIILPEYSFSTPTHFSYWYDFLRHASERFELLVIAEKGEHTNAATLPYRLTIQRFQWFLLRAAEIKLLLLKARIRGYRNVYVHYSFFAAFLASTIMRPTGGRVWYWNCGMPWQYQQGFLRRYFEWFTYHAITYLVTGTENLKKDYAKQYGIVEEKIKVMPNWIDTKNFYLPVDGSFSGFQKEELRKKLNIPQGAAVILFVHRLSQRKGAHYLPEIIDQLRNENVVLLIAGSGPEEKNVKLKIENLKLKHSVRLLGNIPQSEIGSYFAASDVFIMPSEEEGFPHVMLETMAAGVPFVAFDVGGTKFIVSEALSHWVVKPGDINTLIARIRELLTLSPNERAEFAAKEKIAVERFDIQKVLPIFTKLFI